MPQRLRVDLADVAAWDNVEAALWAAARGKRSRPDVAAVLAHGANSLAPIVAALAQGRMPVGQFRRFAIRDPKPRIIHAAPFADRVAHHALMRRIEARLEQALVPSSYACRPGRGVHAALLHARACASRWPWYLKLDVEHYFPNVPHDALFELLARRVKGTVLRLIAHLLDCHHARPGYGLPIGALTSQHFANQYLGEADRHALVQRACLAHLRYMDDIVLWCASRADARLLHGSMRAFCGDVLRLPLKPACIGRSADGLSLCGMRVYPGTIRLGLRRRRSWRRQYAYWQDLWRQGQVSEAQLQRAQQSLVAITLPAASRGWRSAQLARYAAFETEDAP
ncbi:MAG: hypothetical protein KF778_04680 [Rhodocyclaceae bacterium]|nr:hypothetical protein [Rhodocyclaceae bacterium]